MIFLTRGAHVGSRHLAMLRRNVEAGCYGWLNGQPGNIGDGAMRPLQHRPLSDKWPALEWVVSTSSSILGLWDRYINLYIPQKEGHPGIEPGTTGLKVRRTHQNLLVARRGRLGIEPSQVGLRARCTSMVCLRPRSAMELKGWSV